MTIQRPIPAYRRSSQAGASTSRHPPAFAAGLLLALCAASAVAAEAGGPVGELRVYPSGLILGAGWRQPLGLHDEGQATLLYHRARRGANGRHEDERGNGAGIGLAWEHFFRGGRLGWSVEGRADLSALRIDYRDGASTGRSDISVLRPTIGAGYSFASEDGSPAAMDPVPSRRAKVNTIMEVIHAAGKRTAWSDKQPGPRDRLRSFRQGRGQSVHP